MASEGGACRSISVSDYITTSLCISLHSFAYYAYSRFNSWLPTALALWLCTLIGSASRKSKNLNIEESHPEETVKKSNKYTLSCRTFGTNICKRRMNSSSLADKSYCLGTVSLTARAVPRQSINQILIISSLFRRSTAGRIRAHQLGHAIWSLLFPKAWGLKGTLDHWLCLSE